MIGERIGPFQLTEELGSGAMGTVYKAAYEDGRVVALKLISIGLKGNENAIRRFERESKILKQLKHPNIVRHFGAGRHDGVPYFAMEYVEGEPLDEILARRLRFSWEEIVLMGKQMCAALQHAHEKGIIHRDIKPSNLMRLEDGTVKLTDFGIAKDIDVTALTGANCTVGTAAYMSPEQCRGEAITSKSDLYSLGVVFFELLTGRKPFLAESPVDMFMKHVNEPPPRPNWVLRGSRTGEIPTWLETVVLQMLEKKPEHRPRDAEMVGKALDEGLENYYAGKSAAVDAVQARAGDRRIQTSMLDETDREAARTLRGAIQKKKIRKKGKPFVAKAWFILPAAALLMIAFAGILWLVTRPPSPDDLYRQAERKMEKRETYMEALYRINGSDGPVREFLRRYPDHPNAGKVRDWQDLAETTDLLDRLKHNASQPKVKKQYLAWEKIDPAYESRAADAMRYEEYGDLSRANRLWTSAWEATGKDEEQRVPRRLAEMQNARIEVEWKSQQEKEPERFKDEKTYRKALLQSKLAEAKKLSADRRVVELKKLADDTESLYGNDPDDDVKALAADIAAVQKPKSSDKKDAKPKDEKPADDKKQA